LVRSAMAGAVVDMSHPFGPGGTWTTEAVYRESRARARQLVALGVVGVGMEAAAVWAVARHRRVRAASLFVVSDELGGEGWNPGFDNRRLLAGHSRARRLLMHAVSKREAWNSSAITC